MRCLPVDDMIHPTRPVIPASGNGLRAEALATAILSAGRWGRLAGAARTVAGATVLAAAFPTSAQEAAAPMTTTVDGSLLALLLAASAAIVAVAVSRARALTLARERTVALENALRAAEASEARMRSVVDNAAEAIITIDRGGTIRSFNPASEKIFGYEAREAIGRNVAMLMPPQDAAQHDSYLARYLASGEARIIGIGREVEGRRKDGTPIALQLAVTEMAVAGERMFCGIIHDITSRKRAEEAIRQSEQKLRSYVEQSLDGLLVVDGSGRYLEANPAACAMLGYTEAEILALSIGRTLDPDEPLQRDGAAHFERVVRTGRSTGEVVLRRKDGTRIVADIHAVALGNDRFLGLLRDVTARRLAEQALEQERAMLETRVEERTEVLTRTNVALQQEINERRRVESELVRAREMALEAAEAKARFLANMSHEIRTPMNAMIGAAVLLQDTELDAEQRNYVDTICASGDMLLANVQDILDFSKIESGRLELESWPVDVGHLVEEAIDVVAPAAADKRLELLYLLERDVPAWIVGDGTRLRQILVNLLSNAVKFTDRGEVCIIVSRVAGPGEATALQFTVRDTGIGIPADRMGHLFQAFSQADASVTRRYGGTGLGLAICARLVALAGGEIWAESDEGRGSTFHFTVPARTVASNALPQYPHDAVPGLSGKRILVATDNPVGLYILEDVCRRWGLDVTGAATTADALAALREDGAFDAAILDLDLTALDDAAIVPRLRPAAGRPAVIALAWRQTFDDPMRSASAVAVRLRKPVKHSQVHGALAEAFGIAPPPAAHPPSRVKLDGELARRLPLSILVAEDSRINQTLTTRILAKLGYTCEIAGGGEQVLERLALHHFDVILMDLQMPGMDGLETTRRIVDEWPRPMRPYLIAMTANALPGDRDRCLAAGMDDYLAKPVLPATLQRALERLETRHGSDARATGDARWLDLRTMGELRALDEPGKPPFVHGLIRDFLGDAPRLIDDIRRLCDEGDARRLAASAHKLAGVSTSLGAHRVAGLCVRIEKRAAFGRGPRLGELVDELGAAFDATRERLTSYL
jgi:PAS domain S-box-containing protein